MAESKPHGEFTGRHMLIIMLAFFGVIIGVNVLMATLAVKSWTGLVVKNSYVASQEFNEKLAASRAQTDLNWRVNLHYQGGVLSFTLTDTENQPVNVQTVDVALTRPIGISEDRTLSLLRQGDGFSLEEAIPAGVWNVIINADILDYPDFEHRARLIVAPPLIPAS